MLQERVIMTTQVPPINARFDVSMEGLFVGGMETSCISSLAESTPPVCHSAGSSGTEHISRTPTFPYGAAAAAMDSDPANLVDDAAAERFLIRGGNGGVERGRSNHLPIGRSTQRSPSPTSATMVSEQFTVNHLQFGKVRRLVGRSSEVKRLEDVYANALSGFPAESVKSGTSSSSSTVSGRRASDTPCRKQMVLIGGEPGSGKSRLALDTSLSACKRNGGFFLSGKFSSPHLLENSSGSSTLTPDESLFVSMQEQNQDNSRPYSAIGDACTSLIEDILLMFYRQTEDTDGTDSVLSDDVDDFDRQETHRWKFSSQAIRDAWKKEDLQVLVPIVQNIACLWGEQEALTDDYHNQKSGTHHPNWQARSKQAIHFAFGRFFSILSGLAPLVILLDDLQWIDPASLELLEAILQNDSLTRFLVVGTIRNDETTNVTNPSTKMECLFNRFSNLQRNSSSTVLFELHELCIENLSVADVAEWLESILGISTPEALPLAECVHKRTAGNSLYTKEFLLSLPPQGLLKFDYRMLKWRYDVDEIFHQTVAAQNVVKVVTNRMRSLPALEQAILPKIASIGFTFTYHMFQVVVDHILRSSNVKGQECIDKECNAETVLKNLIREGIVTVDNKHCLIKWAHDKIRGAALNLVDSNVLSILRFEIGKLLLEHHPTSEIGTSSELYIITTLLNSEADLLSDGPLRTEICRLNLWSGETALQSSAYASSKEYFLQGIKLLPEGNEKWGCDYSEMSLSLYRGAAEAHFCVGEHRMVADLYEEVKTMSSAPILCKRRVYDAYINSLSAQGRTADALKLALDILKVLGCRFPRYSKSLHSIIGITQILRTVNKRTEKIKSLPPMHDKEKQWIIHLLFRMIIFSYQTDRHIFPLVLIKGMAYTLRYGLAEDCAPILATIGLLLAAVFCNFEGGKQYADLALMNSTDKTTARTGFIAHVFVLHHLTPFESCKKPLLQSYKAGMRSGDLESGFWSIYSFLELHLFTSYRLPDLLDKCSNYCSQMLIHKQDKILWNTRMTFQLAFNLANVKSYRHLLTGPIMNEIQFREQIKDKPCHIQEWVHLHRYKTYAAFWFGEHELVTQIIEDQNYHKYFMESFNPGFPGICPLYLFCALSSIAVFRKTGIRKHKRRALKFFKKIKLWADKGNRNVHHSCLLIEAELASLVRDSQEQYRIAILVAGRWGLTSDQALAHEKLAEHYLRMGNLNDANYHYQRAIELYEGWGALGKIEQLQEFIESHPGLDTPVVSVLFCGTTVSTLSSTSRLAG